MHPLPNEHLTRTILSFVMLLAAGSCIPGDRSPEVYTGGPDMALACDPHARPSCDGNTLKTCLPDGSGYELDTCPGRCLHGVCACAAGQQACRGSVVQVCDDAGQYHDDHSCPMGTQCQDGACLDAQCPNEMPCTGEVCLPDMAWPRFRHDNRNTGTTTAVVSDMPTIKWKTFIGGTMLNGQVGMASGPVTNQNNLLFIGAGDLDGAGGSFYSLDTSGKRLYAFAATRGFGLSTPAVRADGTAYFSTTTAQLYAVTPAGQQAWKFLVGSQADSAPVVTHDGNVIYSSDDGSVYALDPKGQLVWKTGKGGPGEVDGGMAETCDGKVVLGGANGWFELNASDGSQIWRVAATGAHGALLSSPVVTADGYTFGFDSGGQGVAIDPTGMVLWSKTFASAGAGSATAFAGGMLYVVLNDGALHAIDPQNGNEKWKQNVANNPHIYVNAGPVVDGRGRIYFNSSDGYVYAFDRTGTQLWRLATSGKAQNMVWSGTMAIGNDGTLYVPGNDGYVYALK